MSSRNPDHDFDTFISYKITKPFVPEILDAELANDLGWDKCDISFYGLPSEASEENPVVVWVSQDINDRKFNRILQQHNEE